MAVIGEIQKNKREKISVCSDIIGGRQVCNLRVCFEVEPDKWIFTRRGLAFSIDHVPELIEMLNKVIEK